MRQAFFDALAGIAERDPRVMLLTGDLGFMVVEDFATRFPDRFINVGVAEANMLGVATGLAQQGFIPYCYSIATFASMRGYEQLRNGALLHQLPVRVVGVGGGFAYGSAGTTHHALEDLGLMRLQPGMTVLAPGDDGQARSGLEATYDLAGPVYHRLGKDPLRVSGLGSGYPPDDVSILRPGGDILLLATGTMAPPALAAADLLEQSGVAATVGHVACLRPVPGATLAALLGGFQHVVTVEDHHITGGLGSLVAEVIAEVGIPCRLSRLGATALPDGVTGSEAFLRSRAGLSAEGIAERALTVTGIGVAN
ncbi:MAG: transketolase [Chloroflexota bacterium]|nr:transketolase [Chloroflexota bacterium]